VEQQDYRFSPDLDKSSNVHAIQFRFVPEGSDVLDVGCHTGILGAALREKKRCRVVGLDYDERALAEAAKKLDRAMAIDLEDPSWPGVLIAEGLNRFDAILFGDVLEHTRDPKQVLTASLKLLKPGGRVIVSIPNVVNLRVRLEILRGSFEYQESGILDRTHLRFFTKKTARAMIEQAGLRIVESDVAGYSLPHWLIRRLPGLLAVQFVFAAKVRDDER